MSLEVLVSTEPEPQPDLETRPPCDGCQPGALGTVGFAASARRCSKAEGDPPRGPGRGHGLGAFGSPSPVLLATQLGTLHGAARGVEGPRGRSDSGHSLPAVLGAPAPSQAGMRWSPPPQQVCFVSHFLSVNLGLETVQSSEAVHVLAVKTAESVHNFLSIPQNVPEIKILYIQRLS